MNDIYNNNDLYLVVDEFYKKLLGDPSIAYFFTDIVKIKLEDHLPILVNFWSQSLFNTGGYYKNLMQIHLDINEKENFSPELFKIWLTHFNNAIAENFSGTNADKMITQALSIATVMQIKIHNQQKKH